MYPQTPMHRATTKYKKRKGTIIVLILLVLTLGAWHVERSFNIRPMEYKVDIIGKRYATVPKNRKDINSLMDRMRSLELESVETREMLMDLLYGKIDHSGIKAAYRTSAAERRTQKKLSKIYEKCKENYLKPLEKSRDYIRVIVRTKKRVIYLRYTDKNGHVKQVAIPRDCLSKEGFNLRDAKINLTVD